MKTIIAVLSVAAAIALTPALASADDHDSDRSHPVTFVKDSAITTKIKSKLATEHLTSVGRIHVDTDANGNVYLSGTAHSQEAIDQAVSIAKSTEHVNSVQSTLTVRQDD
jgi:hyperosmotically inducible periplasmic protein